MRRASITVPNIRRASITILAGAAALLSAGIAEGAPVNSDALATTNVVSVPAVEPIMPVEMGTAKPIEKRSTAQRVLGYIFDLGGCTVAGIPTFNPSQIPAGIYTHLVYSFAQVDATTLQWDISSMSNMNQFTGLKAKDPKLSTMISVGGGAGGTDFRTLAGEAANFGQSAVTFLRANNLDGLDLDWEFPTTTSDMTLYNNLLAGIRTAFNAETLPAGKSRLLLSMTLPGNAWGAQYFDINSLYKSVDFFNLMAYDLHGGAWEGSITGCATNWKDTTNQGLGQFDTISTVIPAGLDKSKFNMGQNFVGNTYGIKSGNGAKGVSDFVGTGAGSGKTMCITDDGYMNYYEAILRVQKGTLKPAMDSTAQCWYGTYTNPGSTATQMVAFDDASTVYAKTQWALSQGFGGSFAWGLFADAKDWTLSKGLAMQDSTPYVKLAMGGSVSSSVPASTVAPASTSAPATTSVKPTTTAKPTTTPAPSPTTTSKPAATTTTKRRHHRRPRATPFVAAAA